MLRNKTTVVLSLYAFWKMSILNQYSFKFLSSTKFAFAGE